MKQGIVWSVAVGLTLGAAHLGLWLRLGAHPFWAIKVGYMGLILCAVLFGICLWRPKYALIVSLAVVVLAFGAAYFGKMSFVASYAENALAGRLWFYGWIGVAGAVPACLALVASKFVPVK
ncbi:MAG: hypothetical protein JKX69_08245 [Rhodobacteraceae bacterium]|nr:hypothetical protein [Paracoccaceae bacterium]